MSNNEIDAALIVSLGGGLTSPGIEPAGITNRLNTYPDDSKQILEAYLERTMQFPIPENSNSLSDVGDAVSQWLASEMPELSDVTRQKLSSYYTYQWR
jgi:hypothetical protein